eukprot:10683725-Ditylum_brightwellii.AAC.1
MHAELTHNGKTFLPDKVQSIYILGLGSSFKKIIDEYLKDALPTEWNTNNLYKLAEAVLSYKQLQGSRQQLFQILTTKKKEKQDGATTTAAAALHSHQNAIKMMIKKAISPCNKRKSPNSSSLM